MTMLVAEKNRLSTASTVAVRPSIEAHIDWLERELNAWTGTYNSSLDVVPYGGRRMISCAPFPESESKSHSLC